MKSVEASLRVMEIVDTPPADTDDGDATNDDTVGGVSSTATAALVDVVLEVPPSRVVVTITR
jgi:hypothetical protein